MAGFATPGGYFKPSGPISGFTGSKGAPRPPRTQNPNAGHTTPGGYWKNYGPISGFTVPTGPSGGSQSAGSQAQGLSPAGGGPPGGSPGAPGGAQSPPLDSTYYANVAANQFKTNNDINALNLQGSQNDTALAKALGQLNYQQPRDSLKLEQNFNNRGGLYSSVYGQGLADLTHSYALKQGAAQTSHDQLRDQLAGKIAALQGGIPIYNDQQAAASAGRLSTLAQNDPSLGQNAFASADAPFLAPGAAAPNYALTPPSGAPPGARWGGASSPGKGWKGIGGGWWKPGK